MKYLKTVDLWNVSTFDAVLAGKLVLQPGQWVQCGKGKKSRFVGLTAHGTIRATHYGPEFKKRFQLMRNAFTRKKT